MRGLLLLGEEGVDLRVGHLGVDLAEHGGDHLALLGLRFLLLQRLRLLHLDAARLGVGFLLAAADDELDLPPAFLAVDGQLEPVGSPTTGAGGESPGLEHDLVLVAVAVRVDQLGIGHDSLRAMEVSADRTGNAPVCDLAVTLRKPFRNRRAEIAVLTALNAFVANRLNFGSFHEGETRIPRGIMALEMADLTALKSIAQMKVKCKL